MGSTSLANAWRKNFLQIVSDSFRECAAALDPYTGRPVLGGSTMAGAAAFIPASSEVAMEVHVNSEEQKLLAEILHEYQRELLLEISHADHREFKEALRRRAQMLESLLEKVAVPESMVK
jgi:hypothetical protein